MAIISIIIPCYNVSEWIDRCLTSIENQTIGLDQLEIICVDDCSTDDTLVKLNQWEKKYPEQLILISSQTNGRQGTARNIGLSYASGEWIAFIDSDDWVEPDYLEKLYQAAVRTDADVICCGNVRDSSTELSLLPASDRSTGKPDREIRIEGSEDRKALIHTQVMTLSAWGKLVRRDLLVKNQIFFPEGLAYEDIYWGEMVHLYAEHAYILEERLYHYFINPSSTVLKQHSDYHLDMLTIQSCFCQDVTARGFLESYYDELEYEFIYTCALAFLKIIALRFQEPPYSWFRLLQVFVTDHYPNLLENSYVKKDGLPPLHQTLIESLYMSLTKEQFLELMANLKKIGI